MLNGHGCHWRSADLVGDIFANHPWQAIGVRKTRSAFIPIALVATLLTSGVGVAALAETARVDDRLSAPDFSPHRRAAHSVLPVRSRN